MMPGASERQAMNTLDLVEMGGGGSGGGTPSIVRAIALGKRLKAAEQENVELRSRSPIDPAAHDIIKARAQMAEGRLDEIRRIIADDPSHALLRIKRLLGV